MRRYFLPGLAVILFAALYALLQNEPSSLQLSDASAEGLSQAPGANPAARPRRTPTPTPTQSSARSTATPTQTPARSTATPTRTPVAAAATSTPTPDSQPISGRPCPTSVHARYVTRGPDGKTYPTWHPAVDPSSGCFFGHEHGADPATSRANSAPPAFGYVGAQIGDSEPHEGFKVFITNTGDITEERTVPADQRVVFHMGTGGVKRYSARFHSIMYDYVARDGTGREAHIQGMADTGDTSVDGSVCDQPRQGGKDFSTIGCNDSYEIWSGASFQVIHPDDPFTDVFQTRVTMTFTPAVFDPITTRDPRDNNVLIYTQRVRGDNRNVDPFSPQADYRGCTREAYYGPNYWRNAGRTTVYYTDAFGNVNRAGLDAAHPFKQVLGAVNSTNNEQFKLPSEFCLPGVHAPN
jgi:hypothetical protein